MPAIVDSHCHASPHWCEPVEALCEQMARAGVSQAVLTQLMDDPNNDYLFACRDRYPGRFATVAFIDPAAKAAEAALRDLANRGVNGVRLHAESRSPGNDPLALWRLAGELNLTVSCYGSAPVFAGAEFRTLVEALPNLRIVIEHLAGRGRLEGEDDLRLRREAFTLAVYPNIHIKMGGLGEIARRARPIVDFPFTLPIPPLLDEAFAAFGPDRLMWGSDFPPVSSREGYEQSLRYPFEYVRDRWPAAVDAVFGANANRLFPMS